MQGQGLVPGVSGVEFSADGSALLVTHPDELGRPHKVQGKEEEDYYIITRNWTVIALPPTDSEKNSYFESGIIKLFQRKT
jgi:hypothetical protein